MAQSARKFELEEAGEDVEMLGEQSLSPRPAFQAYQLLHFAYVVAPIVAGVDKFFHLLVNWDMYLSPVFARLIPVAPHSLMLGIGVVEIIAGLIVAGRPVFGGYLVALWLWGIIVNLLTIPGYFDIALRDFGLSLGALALARLSVLFAD
jgi:hypothetical protein